MKVVSIFVTSGFAIPAMPQFEIKPFRNAYFMGFPTMPQKPAEPVFTSCMESGRPLSECNEQNQTYYKPRKQKGPKCFCVNPLSGVEKKTDCEKLCRGEKEILAKNKGRRILKC